MKHSLSFFAVCLILFSGCVSKKDYDALAADKSKLMQENYDLLKIKEAYEGLQDDYASLKASLDQQNRDCAKLADSIKILRQEYDDLNEIYEKARAENTALLRSTSAEKESLTEKLAEKQNSLEQQEATLKNLERSLQEKELALNSMQEALKAREARIDELNAQLNRQKDSMERLRTRIKEALLGFSDADLTVEHKNGKIYVSLSQNLLFAKNSKVIDQKGKEALQKLAKVLNQNPDLSIAVEGHTDSDGTPNYNWDLSVERATAVVKLLTSEGVKPERVTASGRALYDPVAPNDTEDNKSRNRRTEIILSPKLDAIYSLLEGESQD